MALSSWPISNEKYGFIKGVVKNIFAYPLPVIDVNTISQGNVENHSSIVSLLVDDSVVTRTIVSKFLSTSVKVFEAKDG